MVKRLTMLLAGLFLMGGVALAQSTVSGTVTDENGEPIVGAAVRVDGTNTGTATDLNGHFSISAPANSRLNISYIGMKPQTVKAGTNIKVRLASTENSLDEIMVVAYGTQKRSTFTGSASDIKAEDISKHVVSTATSALTGAVAGVQSITASGEPGSGPTFRIRGIGSMAAGSSPLYVVDGAPYDGSIASINPNDIQEITVLKDAASTAAYGSRGANGVVIITTKKSRGAQPARITIDAKWGSNHRAIPRYDLITDPGEYYETYYKAMFNSRYMHGSTASEAYAWANANLYNGNNGGLGYQVYTVPEGQNLIGRNFKLNPNAKLGYSDGTYYYQPDDYYDEIDKSSFRQEYNASVSGATDRFSYFSSLGFLNDGGIVENSGLKRYTARTNVEYKINKYVKFASNLDYSHIDTNSPSYDATEYGSSGSVFYIANNLAPIYPLYVRNADGSYATNALGDRVYDINQTNQTRPNIMGNAIGDNHYNRSKSAVDQFRGNWVLTVTPVEGLDLIANVTAFNRNSHNNQLYSQFSASYSGVDGATAVYDTRYFTLNQIYQANYNKEFGKHTVGLTALYEHYSLKYNFLYGSNAHLYDPFVAELDNALGSNIANIGLSSYTQNWVHDGYFFRGDYSYADKYFGEVSVRRDGSSRFAPGHRWGTFWSLSGGWQINKENWFNADWVDLLKLKVSYGEMGNDDISGGSPYNEYTPYADYYKVTYNEETKQYSSSMAYRGNSSLTWEKTGEWNVGVDFGLFKNRITGTLEYFHRKTHDLLYWKTLPLSSGIAVSDYPANVGALVNKGLEFTINGDIFRSKDFTWSVNANITWFKNKITELDPSIAKDGLKYSSSILRVGGSLHEAYMYKYAGTNKENGQALYNVDYFANADGEAYTNSDGSYRTEADLKAAGITDYHKTTGTTNDLTVATKYDLGDIHADVYGGFGTSLSWKGFDLSVQFAYQLGGKIYDGQYQQYMHGGQSAGLAMHKDLLDAWDPFTNRDSNIPLLSIASADDSGVGSQSAIDRFLTSSDYLSLNNLTLGYTLPKSLTSRALLSNVRVYVAAENLFIITARKGLDPRVTQAVGGFTSGAALISGGGYAGMRSITAGISLTF